MFGKKGLGASAQTSPMPAARPRTFRPQWSISYRQRMSLKILFGCILVSGLCAPFLRYIAQTNDRGLILYHIIKLNTEHATMFYWVMFACLLVGVYGNVYALIHHYTVEEYITLTENTLEGNSGYIIYRRPFKISLLKIKSIWLQTYGNFCTIHIDTVDGMHVKIPSQMFETKDIFHDFFDKLYETLHDMAKENSGVYMRA